MPELFSVQLHGYYEDARQEVRQFIAALPCNQIETLGTIGYISSRTTDRLCLPTPAINPEPLDKRLEHDGEVAVYAHTVTNESALIYKPSTSQYGGWSYQAACQEGHLEIRIEANGNPGPKQRHTQIIEQLTANVGTLATEIARGNAALVALIEPELAKRKAQCDEIARRTAEL